MTLGRKVATVTGAAFGAAIVAGAAAFGSVPMLLGGLRILALWCVLAVVVCALWAAAMGSADLHDDDRTGS